MILVTYWEDMRKRMGPDRCVWGATSVTEKETNMAVKY